jgi:hypothetical protein
LKRNFMGLNLMGLNARNWKRLKYQLTFSIEIS